MGREGRREGERKVGREGQMSAGEREREMREKQEEGKREVLRSPVV